ncbi:Hypothetical protein D9617_44g039030 [Elsinoe fawcettii]|nr:Hypothetical protein D9617_44g039030 [Elsinoe fawcettii]
MACIRGLDQSKRHVLTGTGQVKQVKETIEEVPPKLGKLNPVPRKRKSANNTSLSTPLQRTPKRARKSQLPQAASESSLDTADETSLHSDNIDGTSMSAPPEMEGTFDEKDDISKLEEADKALKARMGNVLSTLQQLGKEQKERLMIKQVEYATANSETESAEAEYERQLTQFADAQTRFSVAQTRLKDAQTQFDEAESTVHEAELDRDNATVRRDKAAHDKQDKQEQMKQAESSHSETEEKIAKLKNLLGANGAAAADKPGQGSAEHFSDKHSPLSVDRTHGGHEPVVTASASDSTTEGRT